MLVSVPKEVYAGERRVALTPETAKHLIKLGHDLVIESGAGVAANYSDQMYLMQALKSLQTSMRSGTRPML